MITIYMGVTVAWYLRGGRFFRYRPLYELINSAWPSPRRVIIGEIRFDLAVEVQEEVPCVLVDGFLLAVFQKGDPLVEEGYTVTQNDAPGGNSEFQVEDLFVLHALTRECVMEAKLVEGLEGIMLVELGSQCGHFGLQFGDGCATERFTCLG